MKARLPSVVAVAALCLAAPAAAQSIPLDLGRLGYAAVGDAARRATLALDDQARPRVVLLRILDGRLLPPHGGEGGARLLTVVSGTLSWGDGDPFDPARERTFGPGEIIVLPAGGAVHWAAARHGDVLVQIVMLDDGALAPEVQAQLAR